MSLNFIVFLFSLSVLGYAMHTSLSEAEHARTLERRECAKKTVPSEKLACLKLNGR